MGWTGVHFAIGLMLGGSAAAGVCVFRDRGWKAVPVAMLLCGLWAIVPDVPEILRQGLPGTWIASGLGAQAATDWLNQHSQWFFFHHYQEMLVDSRWGLRVLTLIGLVYNALLIGLFTAKHFPAKQINRPSESVATDQRLAVEQEIGLAAAAEAAEASKIRLVGSELRWRRKQARIKSEQAIQGVAVKLVDHASIILANLHLIDLSDGGLALSTDTAAEPGSVLYLCPQGTSADKGPQIEAVVLEQLPIKDGYKMRCKVIGKISPMTVFQAA